MSNNEPAGGWTFDQRMAMFRAESNVKVDDTIQPNPSTFDIITEGEKEALKKEKSEFIPMVLSRKGAYLVLSNNVDDVWDYIKDIQTILLVKPVQSGKTGKMYKIIEHLYRTHIILCVSAKNKALAGQTNGRGRVMDWVIKDFSDLGELLAIYEFCMKQAPLLKVGKGKKSIIHFLMEYRNIPTLNQLISLLPPWLPICLIVDEADMNRATETVKEEDEDGNEVDGEIPPITRGILAAKNQLRAKNNGSKTVLITATPQGILCSEKDEQRVVVYQEAFLNHNGPGDNKNCDIELQNCMRRQTCKAKYRWDGSSEDRFSNAYYDGIVPAVRRLENMGTKDAGVKQLMLVSLEGINVVQERLAVVLKHTISRENREFIDVIVFNGDPSNKDKNQPLLADKVRASNARKIIIVSGFRASRGVSFTEFSDKANQFELVIQVHAAKTGDPLNSSLQAMRIFGPARRTIVRAIMFCNQVTYEDCKDNFREMYRICRELAEGANVIYVGGFNESRLFTQKSNFHYIKRANRYLCLLEISDNPKDHEPITA